jgi:hypothetical protein
MAKAVAPLADEFARLVGALHGENSGRTALEFGGGL